MSQRFVRWLVPVALIAAIFTRRLPGVVRVLALALLGAQWLREYVHYRRTGLLSTRREYERLRSVRYEAYSRHYNERVPTLDEEMEVWGPYHKHRHEMRYDLVASSVRKHLKPGGRVLDIGCGSLNVADRIRDIDCHYVGTDFGDPHIRFAQRKYATVNSPLRASFARCDAAALCIGSETIDVVVFSEVIEHLVQPELAVWEIARVLRPGGVIVLTTNNASEVPLSSPLTQPLAWLEKAVGADVPALISHRPWVWPEKVSRDLLVDGAPDIYLPHTHHIPAETRSMFQAAGMETLEWSSFEFPPPHSRSARLLEKMGAAGRRGADIIEAAAKATPLIRRLGTHLFLIAAKTGSPVAKKPPPGVWPGPFSGGDGELRRLDRARWPKAPLLRGS